MSTSLLREIDDREATIAKLLANERRLLEGYRALFSMTLQRTPDIEAMRQTIREYYPSDDDYLDKLTNGSTGHYDVFRNV